MKLSKLPVKPAKTGHFRIINDQWRSRKLQFPAVDGLRPTPDRVRETLFNWLGHTIVSKNCLDLFSGCGALGLEALSRGAAHCVFVDQSASALNAITQHLHTLEGKGTVQQGRLPEAIAYLNGSFDTVFIDPPYCLDNHAACIEALVNKQLLANNAWIYCENASDKPLPALPANIQLHRHKKAGAVQYALFRYHQPLHHEA